ncbi:MAG: hypothetical protein GX660_26725 [Clostridiaceae bacterium]|nr:hypothetical protein [Clostridiaceae bacterium]
MITETNKTEFWFHVSNQDEIPIFGTVDRNIDIPYLYTIIQGMPENVADQIIYISQLITNNADSIDILRAFVGVSDKRMYLELSYIFGKEKFGTHDNQNVLGYSLYDLQKHNVKFFKSLTKIRPETERNIEKNKIARKAIEIITNYLISKGVISILKAMKKLDEVELTALVDNLILPKEIQQAETKRRGHGAEWQLAIVLNQIGATYLPSDKHINPMSSDDPNVDKITFLHTQRNEETAWSFDLIIKEDADIFKIFIQGLIHTSDPGQYGVNKSAETILIKNSLSSHNQANQTTKELWGLVDGVGFIENPDNTIFKMLGAFDTFIQLKSLYKAGLRLHQLDLIKIKAIRFDMSFYSEDDANDMFNKYGSLDIIKVIDNSIPEGLEIQAGKAWLYI